MSNTKDIVSRFLGEPFKNIAHSLYDEYVEANVSFRSKSGIKTYIVRRQVSDCCKWCAGLAGIYDYDTAPRDVYRRHDSCRCMVTFRNEMGKYVDVWSKKEYATQRQARRARIEEIAKGNNLDNLNKKKLIAKSEGQLFVDSTQERLANKVREGKTTDADFFMHEKKKLWVDGNKVVFEPSQGERDTANLIAKELGGHVEILPRVNTPESVKSADYAWNGVKIDRKGPRGGGKQTVFNQISEIKGQANCLALDISKIQVSEARVREDLEKAFRYRSCKHLDMVIVIKDNKIMYILERV